MHWFLGWFLYGIVMLVLAKVTEEQWRTKGYYDDRSDRWIVLCVSLWPIGIFILIDYWYHKRYYKRR